MRVVCSSGMALWVSVLCLQSTCCCADDLPTLLARMRQNLAAVRSASAHITVTTEPSAGYVASLNLQPGQKLLTQRELDWAAKGPKWRIDDRTASPDREILTALFDGRTTLLYLRHGGRNFTRGGFLESEAPGVYSPLDHAYRIMGRPAWQVLQSDGFRFVRTERDPRFGTLYVLQGSQGRAGTATTTVWVASERGYQILRRAMQANRLGKTVTDDRTEAMQRVGEIWMPTRIVRKLCYPGRECMITITASDLHVNDVPDSRFEVHFSGHGVLFRGGVPLAIQGSDRLALDARARQLGVREWVSANGPAKLTLALVVFALAWSLVLVAVRVLRVRDTSAQ